MKSDIQGYSSVGRVLVSKTMGRGFKSFCPCQKSTSFDRSLSILLFHYIIVNSEEVLAVLAEPIKL